MDGPVHTFSLFLVFGSSSGSWTLQASQVKGVSRLPGLLGLKMRTHPQEDQPQIQGGRAAEAQGVKPAPFLSTVSRPHPPGHHPSVISY